MKRPVPTAVPHLGADSQEKPAVTLVAALGRAIEGEDTEEVKRLFGELLPMLSRLPPERVAAYSEALEQGVAAKAHAFCRDSSRESLREERQRATWLVAGALLFLFPGGSEERAMRLYRTLRQGLPSYYDTLVYRFIAEGPHTPIDLLRKLARRRPSVGAHRGLARSRRACLDPEVLSVLLESGDIEVHDSLTEHTRGEDFRRSFARLAAWASFYRDPEDDRGRIDEKVDVAVERLSAPGAVDLEPADLLPLLQCERSEVRVAAMAASARLREREERPGKGATEATPRRSLPAADRERSGRSR